MGESFPRAPLRSSQSLLIVDKVLADRYSHNFLHPHVFAAREELEVARRTVSTLNHHTARTLNRLGHRSSCCRYDSDVTCEDVARMLSAHTRERLPSTRVYLCGRVILECGGRALREGALGGAQSRLRLAFLGMRRTRPASRLETIEALWGATPPPSADTSLNVIVSKLRAAMPSAGMPAPHGVATESGTLQLALPDAWFDIEPARAAANVAAVHILLWDQS